MVAGMGSLAVDVDARWKTAQLAWAARPVRERVRVLREARHLLASRTDELCAAVSAELARNKADTLVAEVLPLLAACRFLEREAVGILETRKLGRRGLPFWLAGITSCVERVALGRVLVIGPGNYPLFLPGVQVLQGLAAGNAVVWKPGVGGGAVARVVADALAEAGLPDGLLWVTEESVEAAQAVIAEGVDKVFFTGSAESGRSVMRLLAETLTPSVMELSGCDAVVVLPSAELGRVVEAVAFGMRLNGSATCMAPRRVLLVGALRKRQDELVARLVEAFAGVSGARLSARVRGELDGLLDEASRAGAEVLGEMDAEQQPLLVTGVRAEMEIARADVFAPVVSLIACADVEEMLRVQEACPYALTASIFGDEVEALALAGRVVAGSVLVNDLIVPTADPRVPFGGRRRSGFGVTRGAEGLLEMTAVKTVAVRRGGSRRHYEATTTGHAELFRGVVGMSHGRGWRARLAGLMRVVRAGKGLRGGSR